MPSMQLGYHDTSASIHQAFQKLILSTQQSMVLRVEDLDVLQKKTENSLFINLSFNQNILLLQDNLY